MVKVLSRNKAVLLQQRSVIGKTRKKSSFCSNLNRSRYFFPLRILVSYEIFWVKNHFRERDNHTFSIRTRMCIMWGWSVWMWCSAKVGIRVGFLFLNYFFLIKLMIIKFMIIKSIFATSINFALQVKFIFFGKNHSSELCEYSTNNSNNYLE